MCACVCVCEREREREAKTSTWELPGIQKVNKVLFLTVQLEVFLADVRDDAAKVGAVVAQEEVAVFDLFGRAAVDELARRLPAGPGAARRAPTGQDPRVAHGRPVLALQDEPALATVLQGTADPVGVLLRPVL